MLIIMYIFSTVHLWLGYETLGELIIDRIKANFKCLIVKEKEDTNPHYHLIVETELSKKQFDNFFQTLRWKPKQFSKTIVRDLDKSINYVMKEKSVVYNTLIDDLETYLREYDLRQELNKSDSKEKKKGKPWTQKMIEEYPNSVEHTSDCIILGLRCHCIKNYILEYVLESYRKELSGFDMIIIRKAVYGILNVYHTGDAEYECMYDSFFRNIFSP